MNPDQASVVAVDDFDKPPDLGYKRVGVLLISEENTSSFMNGEVGPCQ